MFRYLKYFECVYRNLGIRAASEELGVAPSTISRAIFKLEEASGKKLFRNFGDTFQRTSYADELYSEIAEPIAQLNVGLTNFSTETNKLTIVAPTLISFSSVNTVFESFQKAFDQDVTIEFRHFFKTREDAYRALRTRHVDFLFDFDKPGELGLDSKVIYQDTWSVFGSKDYFCDHPSANNRNVELSEGKIDFAAIHWLGVDGHFVQRFFDVNHQINIRLVTDNYSDYLDAVEQFPLRGLGATKQIDSTRFVSTLIEDSEPLEVHVIYDKNHYLNNRKIRWFIDEYISGENIVFK